ncbi:hypothetical protein VP01_331g8 [Puccinia sorghi]|uniref:Uncharacterized protein n=1 Tax=Puccinia sorghi TaxID=27349 RepID=A0A0L6UXA2_9BASI|nr:hypothetical protein VP01_331g8 [Puccinia sorghi]
MIIRLMFKSRDLHFDANPGCKQKLNNKRKTEGKIHKLKMLQYPDLCTIISFWGVVSYPTIVAASCTLNMMVFLVLVLGATMLNHLLLEFPLLTSSLRPLYFIFFSFYSECHSFLLSVPTNILFPILTPLRLLNKKNLFSTQFILKGTLKPPSSVSSRRHFRAPLTEYLAANGLSFRCGFFIILETSEIGCSRKLECFEVDTDWSLHQQRTTDSERRGEAECESKKRMALSPSPRRLVQQLVNQEPARASRRRIHHALAAHPGISSASSSSRTFDEGHTCVLRRLPASFLPHDVRRYVTSTLLLSDPTSLQKGPILFPSTIITPHFFLSLTMVLLFFFFIAVICVPDMATPWTLQTNILVFSRASGVQEVGERLREGRGEAWMMGVEMTSTRKYRTGQMYLEALAHQARETSRIRAQGGTGPAHGEIVMPERSGRAVLLAGIPRNYHPLQLENTLINLGFPIRRAASLPPFHRLSNALYWPLIDPSPSCLTHRLNPPQKPRKNPNKTTSTTRFQVLYTPSIIISDYIVGELNHSVPTWLGSRLDSRSSPDHLQSPGWKLLAKVLY